MNSGWAKLGAVLLPAMAAVDWQWSLALTFGLVSGWFCRAAVPYMNRKPWAEVRREFVVSIMISGGSLMATLWVARHLAADALGVGAIAWAVSFGGLKTLSMAHDYIWSPVRAAIGKSPEDLMAERRQEAQKLKAAALAAAREIERDKIAKDGEE